MCGIAGYFGKGTVPPERVDACLGRMRRRGPDGAKSLQWSFGGGNSALLLHSRLSIIDLDARSDQPMRFGDHWIAMNGELYNYVELRTALDNAGVAMGTQSDTEVMLALLATEGQGALDKFEGMWAFAWLDEARETLVLSRDRFGEKPLYLHRDDSGLYFGSEVKFLQALAGKRFRPNADHLQRYLVNGYKSLYKQPATFFEGVEELEAGCTLRLATRKEPSLQRYWSLSSEAEPDMAYEEAVAGVRSRLIRAVELRLRADVPLAFCMSGGVDSNSIIGIASRECGYAVRGFTLLMGDARYDEEEAVLASVTELGIDHTAVAPTTEGFRDGIRTLVAQHDAPVYTISYYVQWQLMSHIAAAGYRVSVSGTAADELFSGYYDHHNLYLNEMRGTALHAEALRGWQSRVAPLVRNPHLQNPDLYKGNAQFRDHIYLGHADFSRHMVSGWSEPFSERSYAKSTLRNRMLNELFHEAVPVILHEDDLNAMYFSIENRSPFLDRELAEFAYRIPTRHLIRDGYAKVVLRDAMEGIVPPAVLWNPRKVGFNAPIESLLDTSSAETRRWLLEDSPVFDIVRREAILSVLKRPSLPNSVSKFLFNFVNSKVFLEQFA